MFLKRTLILGLAALLGLVAGCHKQMSAQDSKISMQVSEGLTIADGVKPSIESYYKAHGSFPSDNSTAGVGDAASLSGLYVTSATVHDGVIDIHYGDTAAHRTDPAIVGTSMELIPKAEGGQITWHCDSKDMPHKYLPDTCQAQ